MKAGQVHNVLALFELFAREKAPRTLTALAQQLDMPKSSAFNLIQTLLDRGFIYETRKRGGYYPTRRMLELASRRSEEHTSELQSLMRISYAVFCSKNQSDIIRMVKKTKITSSSERQINPLLTFP